MNCELCDVVGQGGKIKKMAYNKNLLETKNFIVTPCIGPLTSGHILITSKEHTLSLNSMKSSVCQEIDFIISVIDQNDNYKDYLVSEHGSLLDQNGGACIVHTHLHVIPGFGLHYDVLDDLLPFASADSYKKIFEIKFPYILSFNSNKQVRIYESYNSHSQMMRKAICKKLERNDSDWKSNHDDQMNQNTLDFWK